VLHSNVISSFHICAWCLFRFFASGVAIRHVLPVLWMTGGSRQLAAYCKVQGLSSVSAKLLARWQQRWGFMTRSLLWQFVSTKCKYCYWRCRLSVVSKWLNVGIMHTPPYNNPRIPACGVHDHFIMKFERGRPQRLVEQGPRIGRVSICPSVCLSRW